MIKKITFLFFALYLGINVSGQDITDYILKARALKESGEFDKSIELLSGIIKSRKESVLYLERAESFISKGDYSGAISDFNEANNISPKSGEYGLARIYSLKGDASTALYHLEQNLNSAYRMSEKRILLDPSFGPVENSQAWRQFWKKEWFSGLEKSVSEMEYYTSSSNMEEAKNVMESLKKNYPGDTETVYAQCLIFSAGGQFNNIITVLTPLVASGTANEKMLRILARSQMAVSNYAGASSTFSQLISSGVADAGLLLQRAECYRKTGEPVKALADITKYLYYYPSDKRALSMAGKTETDSGDNLEALKYFSENLRLHPGDPECYVDRANSYFVSKSYDWAVKDFSMSLDLNPDNQEVWLSKGIALLNSGKGEEACHDFRKALSLGSKKASEYISRNCIK